MIEPFLGNKHMVCEFRKCMVAPFMSAVFVGFILCMFSKLNLKYQQEVCGYLHNIQDDWMM